MVVLGVDPHKQTYTVVAVDQTGRQLAQLTVSARTDGQLRLLGWARQVGVPDGGERRWAVEDGRQVAGRLVQADAVAGFFFDQQEFAVALDDGGNGHIGFPGTRHEGHP